MAKRQLGTVDLGTGEVMIGYTAYVSPKRVNGFRKGWVAMAQDASGTAARLLSTGVLTGKDAAVLFQLIKELDYDNLLVVNQNEIAKTLGMQRQHINRSIIKLVKEGILIPGPRIGVCRSYRLNPNFGWRGSSNSHHSAIKGFQQNLLPFPDLNKQEGQ